MLFDLWSPEVTVTKCIFVEPKTRKRTFVHVFSSSHTYGGVCTHASTVVLASAAFSAILEAATSSPSGKQNPPFDEIGSTPNWPGGQQK